MEERYILEIYEQNSCIQFFEFDAPFGTISKGDFINPFLWNTNTIDHTKMIYEVVSIVHIIANKHIIQVHVKPVERNFSDWTK